MQLIISILAFVVAIGVLVTVHEFGHFIVARRLGMKVLRFSIGFGKPLLIWRRPGDDTEYVLSALPLGGYVKLLDEREGEVPEAERPRAFNRQPLLKRLAVVLAGPAFNLIFAVLGYWIIFMVGVPGIRPVVGEVKPGSPAAVAGFQQRDEIVAVAGDDTRTWDAVQLDLFRAVLRGRPVAVRVKTRAGDVRDLSLAVADPRELTEPGKLLPGLGIGQWAPPLPPVIDELTPQGSGLASGLRVGDRILSVDGQTVADWQSLTRVLQASPGKTLQVAVERQDGSRQTLALRVAAEQVDGATVGRIGARPRIPDGWEDSLRVEQRYNPPAALWQGLVRTTDMSWLTLVAGWNMLLGNVSWHNLSGPIDIAQYAGYAAESGLTSFLELLAFVSISLGVLNLLPIPVLDGGQVLYFAAEFLKGSPLSERTEMLGQRIGIMLLMLLMGCAVYNDLVRVFS